MAKQIKPLDQQIEEYKNHQNFKRHKNDYDGKIYPSFWLWDDDWDGQLIKDVQALEQAGFTIVSFSRKRKVTLKSPDVKDYPISKNAHIVNLIDKAVSGYYSISFKPTLSIYWKGRSSNFRY